MSALNINNIDKNQMVVIAGPCMAESYSIMDEVAASLKNLSDELGFNYIFKSSFDKANRTSIGSARGPGIQQTGQWMNDLRAKYKVPTLTDVHESVHVNEVAEFADVLQIPAFLCRQTDLLLAAVATGKMVNVKKGQFLAPEASGHIIKKVKEAAVHYKTPVNLALTERGASFGYGDLVVDMRSLKIMSDLGAPVIFDITHSCQKPASSAVSSVSGGARGFAPVLARAAVASGYLRGVFLEVHPSPAQAKSDADVQLSLKQAEILLRQIVPLWSHVRGIEAEDSEFKS